jgi:hypothetical protein
MTLVYHFKKNRAIKKRGHRKEKHTENNFMLTDFAENKNGEFEPCPGKARAQPLPTAEGCALNVM